MALWKDVEALQRFPLEHRVTVIHQDLVSAIWYIRILLVLTAIALWRTF